jgi:hypothetical protein
MERPLYGSTASSGSSSSTVPPPSQSQSSTSTRRVIPLPPGPSSSPRPSSRNTSRRQRLHRPSILSLSENGPGSSSRAYAHVPASASGSGSSLGSPYAQTLRHRHSQRLNTENGGDIGDNWASLRDMVSQDQDEDEYEEEEERNSDTSTVRPSSVSRTDLGRSGSSMASVRSFFTAKSSMRSERSQSRSRSRERSRSRTGTRGIAIRNEERSITSGLLSSSPPQMNGFTDSIEEVMEDQPCTPKGSFRSKDGQGEAIKGDDMGQGERQPLLDGLSKPRPTARGKLCLLAGTKLMSSPLVEYMAT